MGKIYVTSDWHFCHSKPFLYEPRGFTNVEDMNKEIVQLHNSIVTPEDDVYELGDQYLVSDEGLKYIAQLNGKIHCTIGNHTTDNRIEKLRALPNVVEIQMGYRLKQGKWHFLLSHYPQMIANFDDLIPFEKKNVCLCGHSHTKDSFLHAQYGCYHVELDAHNNKPISLDDVIEDIKNFKEGKECRIV